MISAFWIVQGDSTFEIRATSAVEALRRVLDNLPDRQHDEVDSLTDRGLPIQFTVIPLTPSMKMPQGKHHTNMA